MKQLCLIVCILVQAAFIRTTSAAETFCHYGIDAKDIQSMKYTSGEGIELWLAYSKDKDSSYNHYTAVLPLQINGKNNPDFDRMYALLLKGLDRLGAIRKICVERKPKSMDDRVQLISVEINLFSSSELTKDRKVELCGEDLGGKRSCARVNEDGSISTNK